MKIKIENLSFNYYKNARSILNDINVEIPQGSVVVLLGLNGCGKTTLIKNIVGLLKPTEGQILINEKNIYNMSIRERSKFISYVSQKVNSLEDIIVRDYLTFGFTNELKFYEKPNTEHLKKVEQSAKKFSITHLLDKKINEISGGERQIVSICSAFLQDTEIIILDEPTSALDLKNQYMILKALNDIAIMKKKTIILSSHNPNHALYLNSDVAIMKDGKINYFGKASNIINVNNLKSIYGENICLSEDLNYKEISYK